jgi:hypothetical protein
MKNICFGILILYFLSACTNIQKVDGILLDVVSAASKKENIGCLESPDNCMNQWGLYVYENGDCYEGYFRNGKKDGSGTLYSNGKKVLRRFGERARMKEFRRNFMMFTERPYSVN